MSRLSLSHLDCSFQWIAGSEGRCMFWTSSYRENKLDRPLTSQSPDFPIFFSFLSVILGRVILVSSLLQPHRQLVHLSWVLQSEHCMPICQICCTLVTILSLKLSKHFPLHSSYCFLVLLSPLVSGPLPICLCAPATHREGQIFGGLQI